MIEKDKNSRKVVKRKVGLVLQFFLNFDLFLFFNVVSNNMYEKIIKWFFMWKMFLENLWLFIALVHLKSLNKKSLEAKSKPYGGYLHLWMHCIDSCLDSDYVDVFRVYIQRKITSGLSANQKSACIWFAVKAFNILLISFSYLCEEYNSTIFKYIVHTTSSIN